MAKSVFITKANGKKAPFDEAKLKHSLLRSGADEVLINHIVEAVETELHDGVTTKELYRKAFGMLRKNSRPAASRYNLKKALFDLGPSGFPFENYIAALLQMKGYVTKIGEVVEGRCVAHEIDVIAEKDENRFMVECKFHSDPTRRCDVKIPLYIQSRFKDVETKWSKKKGEEIQFNQGWLVTNTRFTADATQFGKCMNLFLLSWDYPFNNSLKNWVDETGAHPVTSLTTLSKKEKAVLLEQGIILCRHLSENPGQLDPLDITPGRKRKILDEARDICNFSGKG